MLQQKSSAADFHSKLWNNDKWDDLSGALTQYSMYPLIFLAALLHDHQSCYCGTPPAICSNMLIRMNLPFLSTGLEQKATPALDTAKLLSLLPPPYLLRVSR